MKLAAYEEARSISIFLSMPKREVSTTEIVLDALRNNKKVFIPYIYTSKEDPKSKEMEMLRLKDEADLQGLKPDAWGIPSLSAEDIGHRENAKGGIGLTGSTSTSSDHSKLDLMFMPGMAFDHLNHRLGHGRGFYDRYLSRLQESDPTAISFQSRPILGKCAVPKHFSFVLLTIVVGLALRQQLLAEGETVPVDERDWQIDQLVIAD